uniref:Uncharacterized protein LOC111106878 n=1 Tax=Crassostrea virginica TaxID=6565 RepID=A0A8B8B334_CRAVI|nr:uncharacterized protein LOC111106878 [Crassostrea virginica]
MEGNFRTDIRTIYISFSMPCVLVIEKKSQKEKKRLQHLIRLSTMDQGCWELVVKIKDKHPSTSMLAFGDVSRLSIEQTKHIMQTVISNEISVAKMKILFKESPSPSETATLTLQRIRGTANKERKRKSNGPEPQIPSKVHTAEEGEKERDFRAKDLIGLQDQCRNLQREIEEKGKLKDTLEENVSKLNKEIEEKQNIRHTLEEEYLNLNAKLLQTSEEKRALEKDVSSLKRDVLNIQKKTSDLEEEVAALQDLSCKQPEDALNTKVLSSMPFAIPIAQTEEPNQLPAFETTNKEFVTAVVVEYTNNRPGRR